MSKPLTMAAREILEAEIKRAYKRKIKELRAEIERKDKLIEQMRVCKICRHYDSDDLGTDHYCNLGVKPPRPCEEWELDDGEPRVWAALTPEAAGRNK